MKLKNIFSFYSKNNKSICTNISIQIIVYFYFLSLNQVAKATIIVYDENNTTLTNYDSLQATFGPNLPDDGFVGYIALANPIEGCTKMDSPPNISYVDPKSWIALIKRTPGSRSNCTFDLKVFNAQRAGFSAVIIHNVESNNIIKMSSSGLYSIKIPSIFIGASAGGELKDYFTYINKTYVRINGDDSDFNYLLIPFVCVVSVCFLVAIFIFLIKFALHCHKVRKNRFPRSALKKIPTKKYQKTDKYDTCPICLNEYEEGVKIRILPCEHAYHIECIDKWLLRNNRACPVCKRRVIPGGSDSESEDSTNVNQSSSANLLERQVNNPGTAISSNTTNIEETEPNEDEDTNESSRLLVTNKNHHSSQNNDNNSILTTSTHLNNNFNNELSSLNNQMITSITSGSNQNNQNKELRSSSSKYGSISSINLLTNSSSVNFKENSNNGESNQSKSNANFIDSKATPEYFTPRSGSGSFINSEINDDNLLASNEQQVASSASPFLFNNLDKQIKMKPLLNTATSIITNEKKIKSKNSKNKIGPDTSEKETIKANKNKNSNKKLKNKKQSFENKVDQTDENVNNISNEKASSSESNQPQPPLAKSSSFSTLAQQASLLKSTNSSSSLLIDLNSDNKNIKEGTNNLDDDNDEKDHHHLDS